MKLTDIKIKPEFENTYPALEKYIASLEYYRKYKELDRDICVNENMELIDGYVAYMVAKEVGLEDVPVHFGYAPVKYVFGHHIDQITDKLYVWRVKKCDRNKVIEPGMKVFVNACGKTVPIIVTSVKMLTQCPVNKKVNYVVSIPEQEV